MIKFWGKWNIRLLISKLRYVEKIWVIKTVYFSKYRLIKFFLYLFINIHIEYGQQET